MPRRQSNGRVKGPSAGCRKASSRTVHAANGRRPIPCGRPQDACCTKARHRPKNRSRSKPRHPPRAVPRMKSRSPLREPDEDWARAGRPRPELPPRAGCSASSRKAEQPTAFLPENNRICRLGPGRSRRGRGPRPPGPKTTRPSQGSDLRDHDRDSRHQHRLPVAISDRRSWRSSTSRVLCNTPHRVIVKPIWQTLADRNRPPR